MALDGREGAAEIVQRLGELGDRTAEVGRPYGPDDAVDDLEVRRIDLHLERGIGQHLAPGVGRGFADGPAR